MTRIQLEGVIKAAVGAVFAERQKRQQLAEVKQLQKQVEEITKNARALGFIPDVEQSSQNKTERVRSAQRKLDEFDRYHETHPSNRIWGNPVIKMQRQQLKRELIEAQTGETPIWSHLV